MRKSVYIVSTYYHAFIACVKQLVSPTENTDIFVTDYIPKNDTLTEKLRESGLFGRVAVCGRVSEYSSANLVDFILFYHGKNAAAIKKQLTDDFSDYDNIFLFHEDTWAAHYCQDKRLEYSLIEDGLDSYKILPKTGFAYMIPNDGIKDRIKRIFGIGYTFCGYSPLVRSVEVNDTNGIRLPKKCTEKMLSVPRSKLFGQLSDGDIDKLTGIFMRDIPLDRIGGLDLLMTTPLYEDGLVSSQDEQKEIYRKIASEHFAADASFAIKPHPRDGTDYVGLFPNAIILDKNMPMEILGLIGVRFSKLVSLPTTSLGSFSFADEVVIVDAP